MLIFKKLHFKLFPNLTYNDKQLEVEIDDSKIVSIGEIYKNRWTKIGEKFNELIELKYGKDAILLDYGSDFDVYEKVLDDLIEQYKK